MRAREEEIEAFLEIPAWKQVAHRLVSGSPEIEVPGQGALTSQLPPGTRIGPYEIVRFIAAGGMGEVYAGHDSRLDRPVALKRLPAGCAADADRLRLFEQEARSGAALSHANVLAVYDVGTHEGCPYLVTEQLEGDTLRTRLDRGRLSVLEAMDFALQLARGLAAVHAHGIVHGDVKPQNVFLTRDGTLKLLDFGLARLVHPGHAAGPDALLRCADAIAAVRGTVGYMAPEQLTEGAFTTRVDVFSFGCVVYEMLTGVRAFGGHTAAQTVSAIADPQRAATRYPDRELPPGLRELVDRCLEKRPELRPASMAEIANALRALLVPVAPVRSLGLLLSFVAIVAALVALTPLAARGTAADRAMDRWQQSPAYEEYVRGFALSHSLRGGPEVLAAARTHYEAALRLEPAYPLALVGLADIEIVQFFRGFDPSPERIARAEALVRQVLAAEPELSEAHYVLGSVLGWGRRDFEGAVRAFEEGIRLKPTGKGWQGLAWALASLDPPRAVEAEQAARNGLRLAPDYEYSYFQLARALRHQRRYDEAILALEDAVRISPSFAAAHALMARIYLEMNEPLRALAVLDAAPAGSEGGNPRAAERAVGAFALRAYRSAAHAALGHTDLALAELEIALANGYRGWELLDGSAFGNLRQEPRFKDLLARYRQDPASHPPVK